MSRATEAFEQLDAAVTLLGLAGSFCEEPEEFEKFKEWARREIQRTPDDTPLGQISDEQRQAGLQAIEDLTRKDLIMAAATVAMFMDGIRDSRFVRTVPDEVLDLFGALGGRYGR